MYAILERARNEYHNQGGPVGWFRKIKRKAADNAVAPLQGITAMASKMAPDDPFFDPFAWCGGDFARSTSRVLRTKIWNSHHGRMTSVFRGGKAVVMRGEYEKQLVESLTDINTESEKLLKEASKSHMHEVHLYSKQGLEIMGTIQNTVVGGFNSIEGLLAEHTRKMDAQMGVLMEQGRESQAVIRHLVVENSWLRSVSPALSSPWPPPALPAPAIVQASGPVPLPAPTPTSYISQNDLREMLEMSETDLNDMDLIFSKKSDFLPSPRLQAEQIVQQQLFANWVVSASSSKLLVQWEAPLPRTIADASPLSLFCTNMAQVLAANDRFLSIQWFCGRHLRGDSNMMLASLVAQLLRSYRGGLDMQALSRTFDLPALLEELRANNSGRLMQLLEWLVRALPRTVTLFCPIDGVNLYERQAHWAAAEPVLLCLLQLANGTTAAAGASVKVLFTSTPGPAIVRGAFEDERLIINVETLPRLAMEPSEARFARELGTELGV
ncbi:uncharacterized protein PG986_004267 [Apiospora aurea]|uniref:Uncharacterized protein n=1 Tax=Apiospora aurea TaxID=335848 RepID=A0ABR1QM43_9PEZI